MSEDDKKTIQTSNTNKIKIFIYITLSIEPITDAAIKQVEFSVALT